MKADLSRLRSAEPGDEWLQQQGRLWLDSDWNEAVLARLRHWEWHVADLVGRCGRPQPGTAFQLGDAGGGDLTIGGGAGSAGHLYVDGVLVRNDASTTYGTQPDLPGAPPLPLPSAGGAEWELAGDLGTARAGHQAVSVAGPAGRRVLVCGGTSAGVVTGAAELFDQATGSWTAVASMTTARTGHTATVLPDGRVVVAGGIGSSGLPLVSIELYDPRTQTWAAHGTPLATARTGHTATLLDGGVVVFVGGFAPAGGSLPSVAGSLAAVADGEVFDPGDGSVRALPSTMANARGGHVALRVDQPSPGSLLVIGGRQDNRALDSCEIFVPGASTWTPAPDLAQARTGHTGTLLADGRVLVTGGSAAGAPLASCELLDQGRTGGAAWTGAAAMAFPRTGHAAVRVLAGHVLVTGGHRQDRALAAVELFDPASGRWIRLRDLNEARAWHRSTLLVDGSILVSGGTTAPAPDPGPGGESPGTELLAPVQATVGVAYLEVWRRVVSHLQEDHREVALGGPDTTVRLRTVAQVRVTGVPATHRPAALTSSHAAAYLPDDGSGRLSTVEAPAATPDDCDVTSDGTYTGRENRLYRVEILDPGEMLGARGSDPLPLSADAQTGDLQLITAPISVDEAAALLIGKWDLVAGPAGAAVRETVAIVSVNASASRVRLQLPVRNAAYTVSDGAVLVPRRDVGRLAANARVGDQSLRLEPGEGPDPAESAAGQLSRRGWFLRAGDASEAVTITAYDPGTGTATLGAALRTAFGAGTELVPRARFTWSADNASFATAVTAVTRSDLTAGSTTVQVGSLGRDQAGRLRTGDLVEIGGDTDELGSGRGLVCRVAADPDPDALTVTLDAAHPDLVPERSDRLAADHVVLRRWDGIGFVGPDPVNLGDGVRVQFGGYDFRAAQYWWFTTRARDGSVEQLTAAPPHGIRRRRVPLALLHWSSPPDSGVVLDHVTDCVPVFDPLTDLQARHVRYDDTVTHLGASTVQEAIEALAPQRQLPRVDRAGTSWRNDRPLAVNEFNAGLTVRFTEPMAPASLTDRTFEVWLHVPEGNGPLVRPLRVPGVVTAGNDPGTPAGTPGARLVTFRPRSPIDATQIGEWANLLKTLDSAAGVRAVVRLRGDKILNLGGVHALDGTVFGRLVQDGYDVVTELALPSGDGRPGGDFESWLFLTGSPAPVRVTRVSPANNTVLQAFPASIQVMFSKGVRANSVTPERITVRRPPSTQVFGQIAPFPFDPAATVWTGLTFTPGTMPPGTEVGTWEIGLRDLVDVDGLTLDGTGSGTPGPFVSRFTVNPPVVVPVRVSRTSPADESVLDTWPRVIRIEFDKQVRVDSLTPQTIQVVRLPLADPLAPSDVPGVLVPQPPIQRGLTRAVAFRVQGGRDLLFPALVVVDVRGDGPQQVIDEDGLPLDGEGNGHDRGSRFTFSFAIGRVDR